MLADAETETGKGMTRMLQSLLELKVLACNHKRG